MFVSTNEHALGMQGTNNDAGSDNMAGACTAGVDKMPENDVCEHKTAAVHVENETLRHFRVHCVDPPFCLTISQKKCSSLMGRPKYEEGKWTGYMTTN